MIALSLRFYTLDHYIFLFLSASSYYVEICQAFHNVQIQLY